MSKFSPDNRQSNFSQAEYEGNIITDTLKKGDNVALVSFDTFEVRKRAARAGHNPSTWESIKVKASKTPAFKAGLLLSEMTKFKYYPKTRQYSLRQALRFKF